MIPVSLLSLLCALFFVTPVWSQDVQIHDPWIRAAPPVSQTLAAYMTIMNHSTKEKTIQTIQSPMFAKIELHETVQHNGMSMMHAKDHLAITPGSQIKMAPGGYHMMLIAPQKILKLKDQVPITITFADQSKVEFTAQVRADSGDGAMGGAGHEHMHH